jgi:hypothetical protein
LKQLDGTRKGSDEVKNMVKNWFNGLMAGFYDAGIQQLVRRYEKCLILMGIAQKNDLRSAVKVKLSLCLTN